MTGYSFADTGILGEKVDLAEITFHCIKGVTELSQM